MMKNLKISLLILMSISVAQAGVKKEVAAPAHKAVSQEKDLCATFEKYSDELKKLSLKYKEDEVRGSAIIKEAWNMFDALYENKVKNPNESATIQCIVEFALRATPFDEGHVLSDVLYSHYKKHQGIYKQHMNDLAHGPLLESKETLLKDFAAYDAEVAEEKKAEKRPSTATSPEKAAVTK